jgi:diaminopimelate decarboxylase/aspartate kinase
METAGMWQQVGFLADAFAQFKKHGLSIDLVSTSEMNVTVSLDPAANALEQETLTALVADLSGLCQARIIGPCASVSLVGRNVRSVLPRLGPVLEVFEDKKIHLLSQAASDLNLSFVVDEGQAERLVRRLHELLFSDGAEDPRLGPTWKELEAGPAPSPPPGRTAWWRAERNALLALCEERSPRYVYHGASLDLAVEDLRRIEAVDRFFFAVKANYHPGVLKRFHDSGLGFECVSPGELDHVFGLFPGLDPQRVLFTPNFAPRSEYELALSRGVHVTVDNLHPLEAWPELFENREILLRLDPGQGRGHHAHVKTAGARSKFGISWDQLDSLTGLIERAGARIEGLHAHTGSGIRTSHNWRETALYLAEAAERFPGASILDLGGGLGVVERPGQRALDLDAVNESLALFREAYPRFSLWLEPGRFLVARAGALLARVTQIKHKGDRTFVGVETGMNSLIRPALYGAWHQIVNLTRLDEPPTQVADIVGPICESGDVLGNSRRIAPAQEGDVLLVATGGAYGYAMSSRYNLREPAEEVLL